MRKERDKCIIPDKEPEAREWVGVDNKETENIDFGIPKNYKNDFKTPCCPENTHGGKRVNAGRKTSVLGKSDNHTVTLHQKQDEYLRNKFGTLSKALKSLLPKKLQ